MTLHVGNVSAMASLFLNIFRFSLSITSVITRGSNEYFGSYAGELPQKGNTALSEVSHTEFTAMVSGLSKSLLHTQKKATQAKKLHLMEHSII